MRVAIVSYGFPPIRHVSGTRAARMADELAKLGFDVVVVTIDWRVDGMRDEVSNGVRVTRVDPRRWFPAFDPTRTVTEPERPTRFRALTAAHKTWTWGPFEGWGRAALEALLDLHAQTPIEVVWAIHGDDSAHEAVYRFHRATRVPWVADFKDPWHIFHSLPAVPLQLAATVRRLRTAASMTETCRQQAEADAFFARPVETIWSGYDAAVMGVAPPIRSSAEMSFVYVGGFSVGQHDVPRLARILDVWDARAPNQRWGLHVHGKDYDFMKASFASASSARRLHFHPFATQERAYGMMKGADTLVLFPASNGWRGGGSVGVKELEYMASGAPVLCLGRLIDELQPVGARCPAVFESGPLDEAAIAFLQRRYDAFAAGLEPERIVNGEAVRAFAWPEQAKRLAAVLERAARKR